MRTFVLVIVVGMLASVTQLAWADQKADLARRYDKALRALQQSTITLDGAVQMAVDKVPGSKAVEAFLTSDEDKAVYQVEVIANRKHTIVELDAKGGMQKISDERIEQNPDTESAAHELTEDIAASSRTPLRQILQAALSKRPGGKIFEIEPTRQNDQLLYKVDLFDQGKFERLIIEGTSGKILSAENQNSP